MIKVTLMQDDAAWDNYVARHEMSNAYHLFHWQKVISNTYGHKTYALAAVSPENNKTEGKFNPTIKGILPLVHMKTSLFDNRLISMPFYDHGGVIADNPEYELELIKEATALGKRLKAQRIELRHLNRISFLDKCNFKTTSNYRQYFFGWTMRPHKVRLLLYLPESSEDLMKAFKSKLRSQIKRPIKAGFRTKIGGIELLDDFYNVFSINMRDLGSPVHNKKLQQSVLTNFPDKAKIVAVYKEGEPISVALMVGCKNVMINPWASSIRKYSKESPNMLLYWTMLAYAADNGFREFDFGRSTPDEGTYHFKTQWGAKPYPMYWYTLWLDPKRAANATNSIKSQSNKGSVAIALWKRLPISVSRLIGPYIRKHIDL